MLGEIRRSFLSFRNFVTEFFLCSVSLLGVGVSHPIEVRKGTVTEGINYEKKGNTIRLAMLPSLHLLTQTCPSYDLDATVYRQEEKARCKDLMKVTIETGQEAKHMYVTAPPADRTRKLCHPLKVL